MVIVWRRARWRPVARPAVGWTGRLVLQVERLEALVYKRLTANRTLVLLRKASWFPVDTKRRALCARCGPEFEDMWGARRQ